MIYIPFLSGMFNKRTDVEASHSSLQHHEKIRAIQKAINDGKLKPSKITCKTDGDTTDFTLHGLNQQGRKLLNSIVEDNHSFNIDRMSNASYNPLRYLFGSTQSITFNQASAHQASYLSHVQAAMEDGKLSGGIKVEVGDNDKIKIQFTGLNAAERELLDTIRKDSLKSDAPTLNCLHN